MNWKALGLGDGNANAAGRLLSTLCAKLRDSLALQEKLVTIDNIQKTVAEYLNQNYADLLSKRRSRSVARPRQWLWRWQNTNHSLPEIGDAFGGRDTIARACRKIGGAARVKKA